MEGVLFPNLVRSAFMQWSRLFNELEQCLFWNLTGESVESFLQIVRDVGPAVYSQTRRGDRRQIHYSFTFRSLY
jgi:hypothetical protein